MVGRPIVKRVKGFPVPSGAHAITLWPFIFVRRDVEYTEALQAHEEYHWNEARKCPPAWYLAYLVLLPFYGGGRNHPLEKGAYRESDIVSQRQSRLFPRRLRRK